METIYRLQAELSLAIRDHAHLQLRAEATEPVTLYNPETGRSRVFDVDIPDEMQIAAVAREIERLKKELAATQAKLPEIKVAAGRALRAHVAEKQPEWVKPSGKTFCARLTF